MAPSGGLMVPMALRIVRHAVKKTSSFVRAKLAQTSNPVFSQLEPVLVRKTPRQPIHPAAFLRQSKGRWYTTHSTINATFRRFTSSAQTGIRYDRASFPKSNVGASVSRLTTRTPFASTLRPNLTGGVLPRTAGGYATGAGRMGGARHFSHTPAAPAEVFNNVSAAVRAFWLQGQKTQFDGVNPRSGEKRFRSVSAMQDEAARKIQRLSRMASGSFVDFHLTPTVTALSTVGRFVDAGSYDGEIQDTLNSEGLLDVLSSDFSRSLKELSIVQTDLNRLSAIGDLPISMPEKSVIRVHFPGCDRQFIESLCGELGIRRGIVRQDEDFDATTGADVALMFPFAPSKSVSAASSDGLKPDELGHNAGFEAVDWRDMVSSVHTMGSPGFSTLSDAGLGYEAVDGANHNPWLSPTSGYSSLHASDEEDAGIYFEAPNTGTVHDSSQYEGIEGIYRFLEECDRARR
ncbi:MAG: hypothetical protein M1833_001781 [Piccolia ochrophora]|nr:MAG: hypothetical protein M1833_001781 [Piccolia ochrophora]